MAALLLSSIALSPGAAVAQQRLPGQPGLPAATCGPGNNSRACQELRQAIPGGAIPGLVRPRLPSPAPAAVADPPRGDFRPRRLVPPSVSRLLEDPRIDPAARAFLLGIAGKPNEEWTLADMQTVTAVVPVLAEMHIATARLSEFYEYLGLDPANLFEPQLGGNWQAGSTLQEPRNYARISAYCIDLQRRAMRDPSSVKVDELLACAPSNGRS